MKKVLSILLLFIGLAAFAQDPCTGTPTRFNRIKMNCFTNSTDVNDSIVVVGSDGIQKMMPKNAFRSVLFFETFGDFPATGSDYVLYIDREENIQYIWSTDEYISITPVFSTPTLQQIQDNNHDLTSGNFYAGTGAGVGNSGNDVTAIGEGAGDSNIYGNVNLLGKNAVADNESQTVLSKNGVDLFRIDYSQISENRKMSIPDANGRPIYRINYANADINGDAFMGLQNSLRFGDRGVNMPVNAGPVPGPLEPLDATTWWTGSDSMIEYLAFTDETLANDIDVIVTDNFLSQYIVPGMEYKIYNGSSHIVTLVADTGVTLLADTLVIPQHATAILKYLSYGNIFSPAIIEHTFAVTYEFGSVGSASTNDLNDTTLLGNFTEQDIEFQAGASLKFNSGVWTGELNGIGLSANRAWAMFDANGTVAHSVLGAAAAANGDITPPNAAADNTTKGVSSFSSADFDASVGNISLDYTNGQKATTSLPGFLSATDWTTFNNKQAAITPQALTKTDDTNVTLTLGGTPSTSLLQPVSLTVGWTGTLSDARIASASNWNTAYSNRITSLTTTGSSGAASLSSNVLNIPNYTLAGLGGKAVATGNNYKWETTDSSGNLQETTVTAGKAVATDANGLPVASATSATELGYLAGVTSAVQTQLDNRLRTIARSGTAGTPLTGTTTETEVLRITLPIGTISASDWLTISRLYIVKTTAVSTITVKLKLSTSGTLPSGTTGQIATYTTSSSAQTVAMMRKFWQESGNLTGVSNTVSILNDASAATAGSPVTTAFNNVTTQYYLHVSFTLGSGSDSGYLAAYEITN